MSDECGEKCRATLIEGFVAMGIEAHVTTLPPITPSAYKPFNLRCPHGQLWYAEPTSEQIMRWAQEGTP